MNWLRVATLVLEYAPAAIDVVERLFSRGDNDTKRLAAAKEVTQALKSVLDENDFYPDFSQMDRDALYAALKDEARFGEEVAKVNDAVIAFQKYVDSYKVEDE